MIGRVLSRVRAAWLRMSGRLPGLDARASLHYTAEVTRASRGQIVVERGSIIARHAWLNALGPGDEPVLMIRRGAAIGRNNVISAKNRIEIGEDVVTAPQVLIMDHAHAFEQIDVPILRQGVSEGRTIVIEPGCWIGFGAVVVSNHGELRIGRNSVVGANAVVTSDVPAYSVVVGTPARVVKRYSEETNRWERWPGTRRANEHDRDDGGNRLLFPPAPGRPGAGAR
jgi:carbonic anhydrase/acetyltransferase-like protein (isoleucine patch superfamily)